ncbi:MAG: BolA family protein [Mariprofundaceae bacterium]|nr:BolA family protein [Mariprofundaceae bacterium]
MSKVEQLQQALESAFQPEALEIIDESYKHAGHAGVKEHGGGHFVVHITADIFAGKSLIARHRLVNDAARHLFGATIHALSIHAKTNKENP